MKRKTLSIFPGEQNPGGVLTVMRDVAQSHEPYQNNFCIPSINKQNLHIHVSHIIFCMNNRVKVIKLKLCFGSVLITDY